MTKLNGNTLTIAAVILVVLALLFLATPILSVSGLSGPTGLNRQFNGLTFPGGQNGTPGQVLPGQGFPNQNDSSQGSSTNPNRQFGSQARSLFGFGLLNGITGTVVYAFALLVSLAAAVGMFLTMRWGQIIGIVMAVLYFLLGLVGFIPTLLLGFVRGFSAISLGLSLLHLVLAIAVIVLALIPTKKVMSPIGSATPPATSA